MQGFYSKGSSIGYRNGLTETSKGSTKIKSCFWDGIHQYRLGDNWLESSFPEKDVKVLEDNRFNTSQQGTCVAKANPILGSLSKNVAGRSRK